MEGTRLLILQLLQKNGSDTVDGLARAIGLAPATIRRHLDILQRDRLVAFKEVRKKTGRPEYSFFLTENGQESLPKSYSELLNMVVGEMALLTVEDTAGRGGDQLLEMVFHRLSDKVWRSYEPELRDKDLESRLSTLLAHLTQRDYFPEVEVVGGELRLRVLNCPFRSVALQNGVVCTFDQKLFSAILGVDLVRNACPDDGEGCLYSGNDGILQGDGQSEGRSATRAG